MMRNLCNKMKRKVAALLVCVMMSTQVLAAVPADILESEIDPGYTVEIEKPLATDSNTTEGEADDREFISLVGRIVYMGDKRGAMDDVNLQLYANGVADQTHKPVITAGSDDRQPVEDGGEILLINDLQEESELVETATSSNADFAVREYHYMELPTKDEEGNGIRYELRDASCSVATASQALFYTDLEATELTSSDRSLNREGGTRLVYVDYTELDGSYVSEKGTAVTLELSTETEDDIDFADDAEVELNADDGSWSVRDAVSYNPLTGTSITYRVAAMADRVDEQETITYNNKGLYKELTEYAYDGGTIYRTYTGGKTFRAEGTLVWEDGEDWGQVRPQDMSFLRVYEEAGQDVTGLLEITVENTAADVWQYAIDGLKVGEKYTLGQVLTSYESELLAEAAISAGNREEIITLPEAAMTLRTKGAFGVIHWKSINHLVGLPKDLDFLTVYDGMTDITEHINISAPAVTQDGSVWSYRIEGLVVGRDYKVRVNAPTGYVTTTPEMAVSAQMKLARVAGDALPEVTMFSDGPMVVRINNHVYGKSDLSKITSVYNVKVGDAPFTGKYTIYDQSDNVVQPEKTANDGKITIVPNCYAKIQVEGAYTFAQVDVALNKDKDKTVGIINTKKVVDDSTHTVTFDNVKILGEEVNVVWNDGNSSTRPYSTKEAYKGQLHIYYQAAGETSWTELTAGNCHQIGIQDSDWHGFSYEPPEPPISPDWRYFIDNLPEVVVDGGTTKEITYEIKANPVPEYETTTSPQAILHTKLTGLSASKKWLDDNQNNKTRPDTTTWNKNLMLYRASSNPDAAGKLDEKLPWDTYKDKLKVTTTSDDSIWKFEISNLTEYDQKGYPYTYYVIEEPVEAVSPGSYLNKLKGGASYRTQYDNRGNFSTKLNACYDGGTIKNILQGSMHFEATKVWNDTAITPEERPDAAAWLWRYTRGDAYTTASQVAAAKIDKTASAGTPVEIGFTKWMGTRPVPLDLPAFDEDGNEYIYFIREVLSGKNSASYEKKASNVAPFEEEANKVKNEPLVFRRGTLDNKLTGKVPVAVHKEWKAKSVQNMEASVTFILQRRVLTTGADPEAGWEDVITQEVPGFSAEFMAKTYTFESQEKYSEQGSEYEYRVVETQVTVNGSSADIPKTGTIGTKGKYTADGYWFEREIGTDGTIINRLIGETHLQIHKIWNPDDGRTKELTFHLYRNGTTDICNEYRPDLEAQHSDKHGSVVVTKNPANGDTDTEWTYDITGLDQYDPEGGLYEYTLEEVEIPGYTQRTVYKLETIHGDTKHKVAEVSNSKGGSSKRIDIKKVWFDDSDLLHRKPVTIGLYKNDELVGTKVLSEDEVWEDEFVIPTDTDYNEYTIKEISIGEGSQSFDRGDKQYIQTDSHIYEVSYVPTTDKDGNRIAYVIRNKRVGTVSIAVQKNWVAGGDETDYLATFEIAGGSISKTLTIDQTNNWKSQIDNLPKYDDNGTIIDYKVTERSVTIGGVSYPLGADGKVTVGSGDTAITYQASIGDPTFENKPYHIGDAYSYQAKNTRIGTKDIVFYKIWKDLNGVDHVARPDIYVNLYRAIPGGEKESVTPYKVPKWSFPPETKNAYVWECKFENMPKFDKDGKPYTYYVEEGPIKAAASGGWQKPKYVDAATLVPEANRLGIEFPDNRISLDADNKMGSAAEGGAIVNWRAGETSVKGRKIWLGMGKLKEADYPTLTISLSKRMMGADGSYENSPITPVEDADGNQLVRTVGLQNGTYINEYDFVVALPKYDKITGAPIEYVVTETPEDSNMSGFAWLNNSRDYVLQNHYKEDTALSVELTKTWVDVPDLAADKYPVVEFVPCRKVQKWNPTEQKYEILDYTHEELTDKKVVLDMKTNPSTPIIISFNSLPKFAPNGRLYYYYIVERLQGTKGEHTGIPGYNITSGSTSSSGDIEVTGIDPNENPQKITTTVTNTYAQEKVSVSGTKTWNGDTGWGTIAGSSYTPDTFRPTRDQVDLTLHRKTKSLSKEPVLATLLWDADQASWSFTFTEGITPFYRYAQNGEEYTYFVKETPLKGYKLQSGAGSISGGDGSKQWTIRAVNALETTELSVKKVWEDESNLYHTRPETITFTLLRKGRDNAWKDVCKGGRQTPWTETLQIGTNSTQNEYAVSFKGLPKYEPGTQTAYEYQAVEVAPTDYEVETTADNKGSQTTTNQLLSDPQVAVTAEKEWDDAENQDGLRKEVTFRLLRDDKEVATVTLDGTPGSNPANGTEDTPWHVTWKNLPKYQNGSSGVESVYRVEETNQVPFYGAGVVTTSTSNQFVITNSHSPINDLKVTFTKTFSDQNDIWGLRPSEIKVRLMRKSTNNKTPEIAKYADGTEVPETTVAITSGTGSFTFENLPYAKSKGDVYEYFVEESLIYGYKETTLTSNSFHPKPVVNPDKPDEWKEGPVTINNALDTTSVDAEKRWNDTKNQYQTRPDKVVFALFQKEEGVSGYVKVDVGIRGHITVEGDAVKEQQTIGRTVLHYDNLPKKSTAGKEYSYQIREIELIYGNVSYPITWTTDTEATVAGYKVVLSVDNGKPLITNNLITSGSVEVIKKWEDKNNQDGIRSGNVKVNLYRQTGNDAAGEVSMGEKTLWPTGWVASWKDLPKESPDGVSYRYRVGETVPKGYTVTYSTDIVQPAGGSKEAVTVTNTYVPKTMKITATKVWQGDGDDRSKTRPASITLKLMQKIGDGGKTEVGTIEIKPGTIGTDPWTTAVWENLPVRSNTTGTSQPITYSVEEGTVLGYGTTVSAAVTGDIKSESGKADNDKAITVTNKLNAETSASVVKTWDDDANSLRNEIKSVTFQLQRSYKDEALSVWEDVSAATVTLSRKADGSMEGPGKIENLPRYDTAPGNNEGREYVYRLVEGYMTTSIGSISTQVNADSTDGGTSGTIGDYTYSSVLDETTTTITNTWKETRREVYAKKIWDDDHNRDGKRPTSITLELWADGNNTSKNRILDGTVDVGETEPWVAQWTGLQKLHPDETPIVYTIKEQPIDSAAGYTTVIDQDSNPYTVTNSRATEKRSYTVKKVWVGDGQWTEDRPDTVTVQLYKKVGNSDPVAVGGEKELRSDTNWTLTWNDLPKYENPTGGDIGAGQAYEIYYSVKEIGVDGYTGIDANGQLANQLNTTELNVTKTWEDQDNHYGRRPTYITVRLERRAGTDVNWVPVADAKGTLSMIASGDWSKVTFTGLPTYNKDNKPYQYRAVEESMGGEPLQGNQAIGYEATYTHVPNVVSVPGTSTITNTLTTSSITGTKKWEDQNNLYNTRPENIHLILASTPESGINGNQPKAQPEWTKVGDTWTFTWKDLPKLAANGTEIVYSVTETVPAGYTAAYQTDGLTITNTLEHTSLKATKIWSDGENSAKVRPNRITVQVFRNEVELTDASGNKVFLELTEGEGWTKEISNLPKYDQNGVLYSYRAVEVKVGDSEWDAVNHATPKEIGGYTVTEVTTGGANGYATEVTNTLIEEGDITVEKLWADKDNQDGIRPNTVSVTLWKDKGVTGGEQCDTADLTEQTNWIHTWSNLPKYRDDGKTPCVYQLEETVPSGYTLTGDNPRVVSGGNTFKLSNVYEPKGLKIQVDKLWKGDAADKTRPETVQLKLISKVGDGAEEKEITLSEIVYEQVIKKPWKAEWKDLPVMYNEAGTATTPGSSLPIKYYVKEVDLDDRYLATLPTDPVSGMINAESNEGENSHVLKITNTLVGLTTAKVTKDWDHKNNPFAGEIKSATFQLQRACNEPECSPSNWEAYEENGSIVTVKIDHQNGATGTGEKTKLPRYETAEGEHQGHAYIYRFVEQSITMQRGTEPEQVITAASADGFTGTVGDYRYSSELTPVDKKTGQTTTTITNTWKETRREVYAKKIWDDDGNRDGKRPDSITLELWADGADTSKKVVLDGIVDQDGETAPWVAEWKELQKFHPDETPIIYTIKEQSIDPAATYDDPVIVSGDPAKGGSIADPYTVTNSHTPETTSYTVKKIWVGDEGWMEDRPESVKVQLYKTVGNGKAEAIEGTIQELNAANSWQCTWNDLLKYENPAGTSYTILYTAKEIDVDGYTAIATDSNAGLQNTLNTTQLTVRKEWRDQKDHYGRRPSEIAVRLERRAGTDINWVAVSGAKGTIALKGSEDWSEVTFTGLPTHNKDNVPYQYRALEESMDGKKLEKNQALGYEAEHVHNPGLGAAPGISAITNTLLTKEIMGTKIWKDQSDVYNTRPQDIRLILTSIPENGINGNQPEVQPEWTKDGDTWSFIWKDLPQLAADGAEIIYSVTEEVPTGYTPVYGADGLTITNTLDSVDLKGTKTWEDQKNRYGLRPTELKLTVYADGTQMQVQPAIQWTKPEGADVWSWQIEDLPKVTTAGNEIRYTVEETEVSLYTGSQVANDLTNHMEEGSLIVRKTLEGGSATAFEFMVELLWNDRSFPYIGEYHVSGRDEDNNVTGEVRTTGEGGVITINSGQKFRIDRLPAGVTYQVTEKDKNGYKLKEKTGDQGTIAKDTVVEALFVNRKNSSGGGGDPTKPTPTDPTKPTNPGPGVPTEPIIPTEPTAPTNPSIPPSIPFDPDDPVIDIPGNPPRVEITDPDDDVVYDGPGTNIDIGGWGPGEYKVYTFDDADVPLGMLTLTIDDQGVPLAFGLPKTGDQGLPYALLAAIMLGALGSMGALIYKRKKEQE